MRAGCQACQTRPKAHLTPLQARRPEVGCQGETPVGSLIPATLYSNYTRTRSFQNLCQDDNDMVREAALLALRMIYKLEYIMYNIYNLMHNIT